PPRAGSVVKTMKRALLLVVLSLIAVSCSTESKETGLKHPVPRKGDVCDNSGGTKITDPDRWREALDSKEVADWVAASNGVTEPYLKSLPLREHFNTRLTELGNYTA